ncbi:MAG TPA: two-component regulator propeller domain-containing protein [Cellvibrio sp.]|nr:two-component regulator propeller domain-containing protein [Cellvibrio sp.]
MAAALLVACVLIQEVRALATRFDNSLTSLGVSVRQLSGVNAIAQDRFGFIWLGGENGLARYDGTEFRLFQFDPNVEGSLPDSYIWQVAIDKAGYVWVVTSKGLCRFNHVTERFECDKSLLGELAGRFIPAVAFDKDNRLYAAFESRLFVLDLTTKHVAFWQSPLLASDTSTMFHDLLLGEDDTVWLGSSSYGLVKLDTKTGVFTYFGSDTGVGALSSTRVNCLLRDSSGRLWVGTHGGGIHLMDAGEDKFVQLSYTSRLGNNSDTASIMDITEDDQGMIWVSADQDGVLVFDQNLHLVHQFLHAAQDQYSLLSNRTKAIFQDSNQDMWIGQLPFGVSFWNRNNDRLRTFQSDPSNAETVSDNAILSFLEGRDGTIWVGTEGGLNTFNPETGKFRRYLSEPDNPHALKASAVLSLAEDRNGDIWVGTWGGGLHRLNPKTGLFHRYVNTPGDPHSVSDDYIWAILVDRNGIVWVGTERQGLRRYRSETDDFIPVNTGRDGNALHHYVLALAEDREGSLWIGTYGGAFVYNQKTHELRVYTTETEGSLASSVANSIYVDSRGGVWLGSFRGVSYRKRGADKFKQITMADGLPAETVSSIVEDSSGNMWFATTNGVAKLHPETFSVDTFSVEHGFAGSTYNRNATLADSSGRLHFGSTEGITTFYPEDIKPVPIPYPVWITGFRLLNKEVAIGSQLASTTVDFDNSSSHSGA